MYKSPLTGASGLREDNGLAITHPNGAPRFTSPVGHLNVSSELLRDPIALEFPNIMFLSAETVAKSVWLSVTAAGVSLAILPPQPKPLEEFQVKYQNPPTVSNSKSCTTVGLLWFDCKAAIVAFTQSYFPYILSTWVVLMYILDTIHTLEIGRAHV